MVHALSFSQERAADAALSLTTLTTGATWSLFVLYGTELFAFAPAWIFTRAATKSADQPASLAEQADNRPATPRSVSAARLTQTSRGQTCLRRRAASPSTSSARTLRRGQSLRLPAPASS